MGNLCASHEATVERFNKKNRSTTATGRRRQAMELPAVQKAVKPHFALLIEFLDGKLEQKPGPPPKWMGPFIGDLTSHELALTMLAPVVEAICRGWEGRDGRSQEMHLRKKCGETLRDHLGADWTNKQCVQARHWMLICCAMVFRFLVLNNGVIELAPGAQSELEVLREEMMRLDQVFLPFTSPPRPWTGFRKKYDGFLEAKFVRDWRPETEKRIEKAFQEKHFLHAIGVNALAQVPLLIDPVMLELVEQFGAAILSYKKGHDRRLIENDFELDGKTGKKREANRLLVSDDVRMARRLPDGPIWLDYNCDKRGRVYAIQHLNYGREDHVRSLFRFSNGVKLTRGGLQALEIHCANCHGATDKKPFAERLAWIQEKRHDIQKIASDPFGTFKMWREADNPFAYLAACIELEGAWKDSEGFVTHLPVSFDGSCNGIQHLALLVRVEGAAKRVNLFPSEEPRDIYSDVAVKVGELIESDDGVHAEWWRKSFAILDNQRGKIRKLCKAPAMTFAYSATNRGMADQIRDAWEEIGCAEMPPGVAHYLAKKVRQAAETLLPGPARVMRYVRRDLARHCCKEGRFLEWTTLSGFHCVNQYHKPNVITVKLRTGPIWLRKKPGAVKCEYTVADGHTNKINVRKALNAAAPNFIHSLDATHLVLVVVNAADNQISDVLTVHDSFACHASHAEDFQCEIRHALWMMYANQDQSWHHLARLRAANVPADNALPTPAMGELDMRAALKWKYSWH
jgi:DNA-dependent RNA polymerase